MSGMVEFGQTTLRRRRVICLRQQRCSDSPTTSRRPLSFLPPRLMGGFLLLSVGALGEYLGRVYDEVRSRPLSIINRVYDTSPENTGQVDLSRRLGYRKKPFRVA